MAVPTAPRSSRSPTRCVHAPGSTERVTGVEPATLCLASTRSSQLSYTRKSEEVLVAPRVLRVNQWPKVVRTTQGAREGCPYFDRLPVARHRDDGRSRG